MKLLVECSSKNDLYTDIVDGIILPLEGFSVESKCFFTLEEIKSISSNVKCEVFVKVNPTSQKDMGLIMKEVNPLVKGKADMKVVSTIIKDKLANL